MRRFLYKDHAILLSSYALHTYCWTPRAHIIATTKQEKWLRHLFGETPCLTERQANVAAERLAKEWVDARVTV